MDDRDDGNERSADEIRRDIERTRSQMDRTVGAIGDKLSPGRVVDELYARLRAEGGGALGDAIKSHPLPFTLMGLGLGWLAFEQARGNGNGHLDEGTYGRAEGRVGPYRGDAVDRDDPDWEYASAATRVKAKVADAAHSVAERAAAAGHAVHDAATSARDGIREGSASVRERMDDARDALADAAYTAEGVRRGAARAKDGFNGLLEQHPMALGAIAFGLGLASGISAPSTAWEDDRLGHAAGRVKDEARRSARETAEKVKGVAQDAYGAAREELDRQRERVADSEAVRTAVAQMRDSAKQVVSAAADAAQARARSEELTPEGMKTMGRRARERAVGKTPADG